VKSEKEIRSHVADLTRVASGPCPHRHRSDDEEAECEAGRLMMAASLRALLWALGDEPDYDHTVEAMAAGARRAP
jgi:hypothetical protein